MKRHFWIVLAMLVLVPVLGRAPLGAQDFHANIEMTGAGLPAPMNGAIYTDGPRTRLEVDFQGMPIVLLLDSESGGQTMIMTAQRSYIQMPAGMAPVTAPPAREVDAENPCAAEDITECVSLGSEEVNGYDARGWQFVSEGESVTAWVSTELDFPVRIETNGVTVNFSELSLDPIDAALFQIPEGFQPMQGLPFGG